MSRARLTHSLDWLILALVVATLVIYVTGGTTVRFAGLRITARSADRAALVVLAVIAFRLWRDRRTLPLANVPALWRALRDRVYDPGADPAPLPPSDRERWRGRAWAAAGIGVFGVVLLWPQLRHMDAVPDFGDPLFSIWRVSWVYHQLLGDPRPLFDANIFHPQTSALTFSDSMLLPAMLTAPLLALGIHPAVACNIVFVLAFFASAFAAYLLVEHLTGSAAGGFVAALFFGFHPYRFEHYAHFELQMAFCMPLALLALHRFLETSRPRYAIAAALGAAAQLYCSMYYAVFFAWYAGAVALGVWLMKRPPLRRLLVPAAMAGVLVLLLAFPLFRAYKAAHLGDRDENEVTFYSAVPSDYLHAHPRSATWATRLLQRPHAERALFPGAMMLILAALALIPPIGPLRLVYVAVLLFTFEISLGFNGFLYPYLYDWLPFMRGLRSPARCSLFVGLTLAILSGFAVRRLLERQTRRVAAVILGGLVVAIGLDLRPVLNLERVWPEPPAIYGQFVGAKDIVLAEFPMGGNPRAWLTDTPHMYFSVWHWAELVNGYSGHLPATYTEFQAAMLAFPDPPTIDLLRARGTTHVTVNCRLYRRGCETVIEKMDALPDFHLLVATRWEGNVVRLYELRR